MIEQVKMPLENYRNIDSFKVYMSDTGLLCAKQGIHVDNILYNQEMLNDFKGGLVENYVNGQLVINKFKIYYWQSQRSAKIDFVIQIDNDVIPIEVKNADNTKSKSLAVYVDTYKPKYSIKISTKNFAYEDNKKIIPLYAVFLIATSGLAD